MGDLDLLIDLHREADRQGPGGDEETCLSITLSGLTGASGLEVADIGCGTGASALVLARELDAKVTAVDALPAFLDRLEVTAERKGLGARIAALAASMDALPFEDGSFDAIWSEGAIYNMGFESGIKAWRRLLRPGGILAVSDLTWLTHERPVALEQYWLREYPGVATASARLEALEASGYSPVGYFALPERCWLQNYYRPMQERFAGFLSRHGRSAPASAVVKAAEAEIALYERFSGYYGYGYFVARRAGD